MKKKKVLPALTSVDLGLIRAMLITECAPLNKAERKKLRDLQRQVRELHELLDTAQKINSERNAIKADAPVFKFLLGEDQLDGIYYGGTKDGQYHWWRKHLREALGLTTKL